jgi:hypothetical protein
MRTIFGFVFFEPEKTGIREMDIKKANGRTRGHTVGWRDLK